MLVEFPVGCKDANDVLLKHGKQGLRDCINNAKPYPVEGIYDISVVQHELDFIYDHGMPSAKGAKVSNEFDGLYKFYPGFQTVVTGIPNAGKSPFVDMICMNLAKHHGQKTAFFTPEHGFITFHAMRLIRQFANKQYLPNYNGRMSMAEKANAEEFVKEHIHYVHPKDENFTIDNILDGFSYLIAKYGINNCVIDPWNTIEHHMERNETEHNYIGKILNRIRYFCQYHHVHMFVVAHPRKINKKKDSKEFEVPTLYDISGSSNWRNIPEGGIVVYRKYDRDGRKTLYTQVLVQKVKYEWLGSTGDCKLVFDVASQNFRPWVEHEEYLNEKFAGIDVPF
jgi:twinkle protein